MVGFGLLGFGALGVFWFWVDSFVFRDDLRAGFGVTIVLVALVLSWLLQVGCCFVVWGCLCDASWFGWFRAFCGWCATASC